MKAVLIAAAIAAAVAGTAGTIHGDHSTAFVTIPEGSSVPGCEKGNECYIPYAVTIDAGSTVTWMNDDVAAHTVTSGTGRLGHDGIFDSGLFSPGATISYRFDEPGEYTYFCLVHPWREGRVVVTDGGSNVPTAPPRGSDTVLVLDPLPPMVSAGDPVIFSGMLATADQRYVITGAPIYIKDDVSFDVDTTLNILTTDNDGRFLWVWTAAQRGGGSYEFYATYEGGAYAEARSRTHTTYVNPPVGSPDKKHTSIRLDTIPQIVHVGDTVTFTGRLTSSGLPLGGKTVAVYEDVALGFDEQLGGATTDRNGYFRIPWSAEKGDFATYAKFGGDSKYRGDRSDSQFMEVVKYGGFITLDTIPDRAAIGEPIIFTGRLTLDGGSPEGAVVYIQDEDTFGFDDLLASAYVDASGYFTTYWLVEDVDPDPTIDIQAVFEGDGTHDRLATPIQELKIYRSTQTSDPGPAGEDAYMKLYRSLSFDRPPLVAIVPSPDSYEEVRRHITPVKEGITKLTATLEQRFPAGNWDVTFDVVEKGERFHGKPDVKIDLVTRDYTDHSGSRCGPDGSDSWLLGWAYYTMPKPVPTVVCSLDSQTDKEIGATAVHEFVHAIGLGHTFNVPGDLMCSVEEGSPTCPGTETESTEFSSLNLDALAAIYGTDGFQNPNNQISSGTKFNMNRTITLPATDEPDTTNTGGNPYQDVFWPEDCQSYEDTDDCLTYYCESYWDVDGFSSYLACRADPFGYNTTYQDVLWPEDCQSYNDVDACLDYYCESYWDMDGFSSYLACLADVSGYGNPYQDVFWPEDCQSYGDTDDCLTYYCESYWDMDGFSSYLACRADVSGYGNPYQDVFWPEDCQLYSDVDACLDYYCESYWDIDGFSSYLACRADPFG